MKLIIKKMMIILIILITLASFISCGKKDTIVIGFSASLSGANSETGVSIRDGLLLKVDQINSSGGINGRMIELIIRDDENNLEKVYEIDKEFIDLGVDVIFGHELSFKAETTLNATRNEEILVLSPTIATSKISNINDNFIRTMASNFEQGVLIGNISKDKNQKVLIVYDSKNAEFASDMIKGFSSIFGDNVIFFSVQNDVKNSEKEILDMYFKEKFEGVFCILNPNDVIYLSQIFYKNKLEVNIYSSNWGVAKNVLKNGGRAVEGVSFVTYLDREKNEKYLEFRNDFFYNYKKEPEFTSAYAYEAATFLFDSIEKVDNPNYKELRNVMLNSEEQDGIISKFKINKFGDSIRELYIAVVKNGKLEVQ